MEINQINFKLNNQSYEITKLHSKNNNLMNIISQLLLKFDKMDQNFKNVVTSSTTEQVYGVWRPMTTKRACMGKTYFIISTLCNKLNIL